MKKHAPNRRIVAMLGSAMMLAGVVALGSVNTGCYDCADYGEYCVELDCCDDLACVFDDVAGYRCR